MERHSWARIIQCIADDWRRLDERIERLSREIEAVGVTPIAPVTSHDSHDATRILDSAPGVMVLDV